MARVHIFAIDWIPTANEVASGGGLRSLQIAEAVRSAGHQVSISIPANCRTVRRLGRDNPSLRKLTLHDQHNQLEVLRDKRPEVVLWLPPLIRQVPLGGLTDMIHVCDLLGLQHVEASMGSAGLMRPMRDRLTNLCAGADLILTGSEEQHGFWTAELSRSGLDIPGMVVPYAMPNTLRCARVSGKSRLAKLHLTGMIYAWSTSVGLLDRVAAWAERNGDVTLSIIAGTDPGGATDRSVITQFNRLSRRNGVETHGEVSFAEAMAGYEAGSLSLDLYEPTVERRLAVPIRTVNALTVGAPVLTTISSVLTRRLQREGAAIVAAGTGEGALEAALDQMAALPADEFGRMSEAASGFAAREFDADAAAEGLCDAIEQAIGRRAGRRRSWLTTRPDVACQGHLLVLTNESDNLTGLRIELPFGALHGRQLISGYTILSRDRVVFTTSGNVDEQPFDAIWAQRVVTPDVALAIGMLQRPFVFDLDDNLLVSPSYREPFSIESVQTTRNLLWSCAVLSCSTPRLGQLLQDPAMAHLVGKVVVTPNLSRDLPGRRPAGTPRCLVWASTDTPALTRSRLPIVKAVRDFCLARHLKLVCIGSAPPDLLADSPVEIDHIARIPYGSYLNLLRSFAPAIIACPLETDADPATLNFINSKSDIKLLEAVCSGLVGVFSRALPYTDSNLPAPILCENSYVGWFEGLESAWLACQRTEEPPALPPERHVQMGVRPWLEAISRVRLRKKLRLGDVTDKLKLLDGRTMRRMLTAEEFNEPFYLQENDDVRLAVERRAVPSAFAHYANYGFREGRAGSPHDVIEPHNAQYWANLVHTIGDVRNAIETRSQQIDQLKTRRALRRGTRQHRLDG